jgi:8-amino-7-oxononanoate synthase
VNLGWCAGVLGRLEAAGLRRHPVTLLSAPGPEVTIEGRRLIQLCSNDYLGLAADPRVTRAAAEAAGTWGAGTGASRLVSGTSLLHRRLEAALAAHKGCEDAVLFSSGYLANTGTIPALAGHQDAIVSDAANHASIIDGCRLSGAAVAVYRHADPGDAEAALAAAVPGAVRRLLVTDSVFSMDGDLAPLEDLAAACERHGAMLLVDEAHATGLLGPAGGGAALAAGLAGRALVMATLSKALGAAGGFVAGPRPAIEYLRNRARSYVFDTAPAPPVLGAALEALRICAAEPQRRIRVLDAARRLASGLRELGYAAGTPAAAIVPVAVGEAGAAMALSARLRELGIFVPAIRPPSVPPGTARLRVTVTAAHTDEHLATALAAFGRARPARPGAPPGPPEAPARRPGSPGAGSPRPGHPGVAGRAGGGIDQRILAAGGLFVAGTGTGVGKTVAAAAVAAALAAAGWRPGYLKPAQTGTATGADDAAFVRAAAGLPAGACRVPYRLREPLAPAVAARLAGQVLDPGQVAAAAAGLRRRCDLVVVEAAGGLLVPFTATTSMAGLARLLALPLLVVATPALGTLNHTALTVAAARAAGLEILGVVLVGFPEQPGLAEATNGAELERLTGAELAGVIPHLADVDTDRAIVPAGFHPFPWLSPALAGSFDRRSFLDRLEPAHVPAVPAAPAASAGRAAPAGRAARDASAARDGRDGPS